MLPSLGKIQFLAPHFQMTKQFGASTKQNFLTIRKTFSLPNNTGAKEERLPVSRRLDYHRQRFQKYMKNKTSAGQQHV